MNERPLISIVIVNYNVKEYLEQALSSLKRALANIAHEIWVVDNASVDGSVEYLRQRFPDIFLIASKENLGFGRANNVALEKVRGKYVVLINPDTVVQEDTFEKLLHFFEEYPKADAATCKIINPDGSFSIDCRHSIPTPLIAFWKVVGLSRFFPNSKRFAQYNLTYMDPDATYPVPAISGSFMMLKKKLLDTVGGFDEQFFMYCEDIDLCHRINLAGFKIYYVPTTRIIHYKGESTKKNNIDYVVTFNKALYQFFQKYYAKRSVALFRWMVVFGIVLRGIFIYIKNFIHEHLPLLLDTLLLNGTILTAFMVRMEAKSGFLWQDYLKQYWIINLISTIIFLGVAYYEEVYPHHRLSMQSIIKTNVLTFTLLASLTFFLKQFAFSRLVVLITALFSPLAMMSWRMMLKRYYRGDTAAWGKDFLSKPTIIVGQGKEIVTLYQKIRDMKDLGYDLIGTVSRDNAYETFKKNNIPVLGNIRNLAQLVSMHRIRQVIFSSEMLRYETILNTISEMEMPHLEYKIVPSSLEVMIGKSSIKRLNDYPLIPIEYAIGKPFNRLMKRLFDIFVAMPVFLGGFLILLPFLLGKWKYLERIPIVGKEGQSIFITQLKAAKPDSIINKWLLLWEVLRGRISLVGAPILKKNEHKALRKYGYKPGVTGLVQLNREKIKIFSDMEKYHLFYLKNQSVLLDLEILFKNTFKR